MKEVAVASNVRRAAPQRTLISVNKVEEQNSRKQKNQKMVCAESSLLWFTNIVPLARVKLDIHHAIYM